MTIKKATLTVFVIFTLSCSIYANTNINTDRNLNVDSIIEQIKISQNVHSDNEINPDKIDESLLYDLGRAIIDSSPDNENYQEFMQGVREASTYDTLEDIYKTAGFCYIKNNFVISKLAINCKQRKSDYHPAFGELLLLIVLVIIAIIAGIYKSIKQKRTEL